MVVQPAYGLYTDVPILRPSGFKWLCKLIIFNEMLHNKCKRMHYVNAKRLTAFVCLE